MVNNQEVIFTKKFNKQGKDISRYIAKNSNFNSQKFKFKVNETVDLIIKSPKLFTPEQYLPTKHNLYRFALVMKSWKIIYKVTKNKLIFLAIIHTAQHPREIKKLRTTL